MSIDDVDTIALTRINKAMKNLEACLDHLLTRQIARGKEFLTPDEMSGLINKIIDEEYKIS